jgi:hypothetical protein
VSFFEKLAIVTALLFIISAPLIYKLIHMPAQNYITKTTIPLKAKSKVEAPHPTNHPRLIELNEVLLNER